MTPDSPVRTIPVKRRNGKLQSCEPCRRRKLSCDHRLPACGRCARRGHANVCYYHPAPMTKSGENGMLSPSSSDATGHEAAFHRAARIAKQPAVVQSPVLRPEPPYFLEQRLRGVVGERYSSSAGILMETSVSGAKPGFLGDISSTAFVAELNNSLGIQSEQSVAIPRNPCLSESDARRGAEVLRWFQDTEKCQRMMDRWLEMKTGGFVIFAPIYREWLQGIFSFMEDARRDKLPDNLERRSLMVWQNTQRPLLCGVTTSATEWAREATGDNLRWETLGLIMGATARLAVLLPPWDPLFKSDTGRNRKPELLKRVFHLLKITVDLSKKCGNQNDLTINLLNDATMSQSMIHGDLQSEIWTSFGELCDTVVLFGLHLEKRPDLQTPFWLRELRTRFFNVVYSEDKFLSTYLGRPPHISYRFCVVQEPSDLSDEEVCGNDVTLAAAVAKLKDGWTTSGYPHRATWRKASSKRYALREDIIEILIGPHIQDLEARVRDVRAREKEAFDQMPAFVHLDPEELLSNLHQNPHCEIPGRGGVEWRPIDLHFCLAIHRQRRHADFLLERVLVNRRKADPTQLLAIAQSLLTLILKSYEQRDFLCEFRVDFADALAFYAVPAAGVLAMELMKQQEYPGFPRSEVLQQLSVLVPALESVRPGEGNYALCVMGLNAVKKVLERVLSRPTYPGSQAEFQADTYFGADIGNDADFLQWLGSVDFDSSSLLDPLSGTGFLQQSSSIIEATTV